MRRALDPIESLHWAMGREEPFLIQWTLTLKASLKETHLRQALDCLQRLQPLLHHTVSQAKPYSFIPTARPLRLRKHARTSETSWQPISQTALATPFPLSPDEACFTLDWVEGDNVHELVFTIDHTIADGRSFFAMTNQFLSFLDQFLDGKEKIEVTPLTATPPMKTLLPKSMPDSQHEPCQSYSDLSTPLAKKAPYQYPLPIKRVLGKPFTQQVLSALKRHPGVTMQGLLCATMMHLLNKKLQGTSTQESFCFSPADIRAYIKDKKITPDTLANLGSSIFHPFQVNKILPTWQLALKITAQIQSAYTTNYLKKNCEALSSEYKTFSQCTDPETQKLLTKGRNYIAAVSNVGRLNFEHFNHLQVLNDYSNGNSRMLAGRHSIFWLTARTHHENLVFEFPVTPPAKTEEIDTFANDFIDALEQETSVALRSRL